MRRQTMRTGTTCVVLLMVAATLRAQDSLQVRSQPAAPARGWALTGSASAEAQLPGLVMQEGPGVRISAPRELALFRPAFRLRGNFTLGATFERQAASGPTAPYGLIVGGDQGLAFVVRPDRAYAVQQLTGGTIAGAESMRTRRPGFALRLVLATVVFLGGTAVPAAAQTTIEYYALDALGSVRVVFDQAGSVVARRDYEPFGAEVATTGTAPSRLFAGLFRDAEAGLDYADARAYQVRTGRFNAPDPVYAELFEPQRWNRYAYGLNNPALYVDPSGLQACTLSDGRRGFCTGAVATTGSGTAAPTGPGPYPELFVRPWGGGFAGGDIGDVFMLDIGASDLFAAGAAVASVFVPGPGESLDVATILDPDASLCDVLGACISLTVNTRTGGIAPNYGAFRLLRAPTPFTRNN